VVDVATRQETRLTRDGGELVFNGRLDWVYEEELASRSGKAYAWSPDGSALAYLRLDDAPVPAYPLVDFLVVPRAVHKPQRYPQPGDPNPAPSVHVVGVDGAERARVGFSTQDDLYVVPRLSWTRDGRKLAYQVLNRAQDRLEVKLLDVSSGASAPLLEERDPHWLNVSNFAAGRDAVEFPYFLSDGRFLWLSERSGFNHAYLGRVGAPGQTALTRGEWQLDRVVGVDERGGWLHFASTEADPRERRLARVRLDGKRSERVSSEPGVHRGELSPDGRFVLDTHSSLARPPRTVVLAASGRMLRVVDQPQGRLDEVDLPRVELVSLAAADGARLHGRLIKPPDFDPAKRYPVVVHVYGGPSVQMVQNAWLKPSAWMALAARGYLVWSLDNRGSWGRGHAFATPIFRDMGRRELADQLEGVAYLKTLPYVDPSRIGIGGWSYGGYMTLYAMTKAPEVWKCGAAGAPVVDWRLYDSIYTERYMRRPADNPEGYKSSSPLEAAASLKGGLLLLHGAADDNVHLNNTLQLVAALIKAGIPHELFVAPGEKHGFGSTGPAARARDRALVEFFEKNL
jgi:dipeptidyl-peptidase-4